MTILTMNSWKRVQKSCCKLSQNYWKIFRHHNTDSSWKCIRNIWEEYLDDIESLTEETVLLNTLQNKRKFYENFFSWIF